MTASDLNAYLGRPGALEIIKLPKGNLDRTRIRAVDIFALGNGGYRVGKQLGGARRYTLAYTSLDYASFKILEAYEQGHQGPGPFVFLDPGARNILTANQSSCTSERNDTNNFTLSGTGAALSSVSTSAALITCPRALAWVCSSASATAVSILCDSPAPEWYGFPVQVGRSMVLSAWLKGAAGDGVIGVQLALKWMDTTGATLSTSTSGTTSTNSSTHTQATLVATPPASAAYVQPKINVVSGNTAGESLYIADLMLHEGTAVDSYWSPGTGILPVIPVSLTDSWPAYASPYRDRPSLVLQEVGNSG